MAATRTDENHEHKPRPGDLRKSRCDCGEVIVRGSHGWRVKPEGHS